MVETEESDTIDLNITLECSKKYQEELNASSKANESCPTPQMAMTTYTTATATSTAHEGPTYGGHTYYRDADSIYTMNTL